MHLLERRDSYEIHYNIVRTILYLQTHLYSIGLVPVIKPTLPTIVREQKRVVYI